MVTIGELIQSGKAFGIFEFFLPFILMFAIFYGLLAKTKIFGDPGSKPARTINLVIALAAAAYIMVFTPAGVTVSTFLSTLFGQWMVLVLGLLAFLMVFYLMMNILKPEATWDWTKWGWAILLIAVVLMGGVFISSGGASIFPGIRTPISINFGAMDPGILAIIIVVILTGLVIYFLASSDGGGKGGGDWKLTRG